MQSSVVMVENLPPEGETFAVQMAAAEVDAIFAERAVTGVEMRGDLAAEVRLLPSGSDLFCLGHLRGVVTGACGRCLEPAEQAVEADFHLTYVRGPEGLAGAEQQELHREDLDVETLPGNTLALSEVVAEQFLLHLPGQLLCRPDCPGLCPTCGAKRAAGDCSCSGATVDPRFAVLAALRTPDDADSDPDG